MNDDQGRTEPFVAPELATALEKTQVGRFHTKGGHGFAAEDANALADRLHGKNVEVVGTSHAANGADRIVDGVPIQTKYCQTAGLTVGDAFDPQTGKYRYQGQCLEVPCDQYDECVRLMKDKIGKGQVPGVVDPQEAENIVKKGEVSYKQARNIARAGTVDSILYDLKSQAVTSSYVFAIGFAVRFAQCKWNKERWRDSVRSALANGVLAGGTSLIAGIIAAQVLRTRIAAVGVIAARKSVRAVASTAAGQKAVEYIAQASLGKAVYGAAAVNHIAKLLRSNVVTATVVASVSATPDFYRAAIARSISWQQFSKNAVVTITGVGAGVAGWMGGAGAGAALGSLVPGVGTVAGGVVGGLAGALTGGFLGTAGAKAGMDRIVEDDAKKMIRLLEDALAELAEDYLLSETEMKELVDKVTATTTPAWLRLMHQVGAGADPDAERRKFAYNAFDEVCQAIAKRREKILLPTPAELQAEILQLSEEISAEMQADGSVAD